MATRTSVADGLYSVDGTWDGAAPTGADHVIIDGGYSVLVIGAPAAAASVLINNGMLTLNNQTLTIGGDCRVTPDGKITKVGVATLVVGGNLSVESGAGFAASVLTVGAQLQIIGVLLGGILITVSGVAQMLGSSLLNVDASGGNRIAAYGCKNLGGNTNVDFYLARGARAVQMLNRRAVLTGME